jgi:hypothetical protein
MTKLNPEIEARQAVADFFVGEMWGLVGDLPPYAVPLPSPDSDGVIQLKKDDKNVYFDSVTKQPLVQGLLPSFQFGTGILHAPDDVTSSKKSLETVEEAEDTAPQGKELDDPIAQSTVRVGQEDGDDFGLSLSQKKRPSAMGLTFQANLSDGDEIRFQVTGARYEKVKVAFESKSAVIWYRRVPFEVSISLPWSKLEESPDTLQSFPVPEPLRDLVKLQLRWRASKGVDASGRELVSVTAVLKHLGEVNEDIFQIDLEATILGAGFISTPDRSRFLKQSDVEQGEIELLYRHAGAFATGHGLAATWNENEVTDELTIQTVRATAIPSFYQEQLSTNVDGISLSMKEISELQSPSDLSKLLEPLLHKYDEWINSQELLQESVQPHLVPASKRLVEKARGISLRMKRGLQAVCDPSNPDAFDAFVIANRAMFAQQRSGGLALREFQDDKSKPLAFSPIKEPEVKFGYWRPFQMGFILLAIAGIIDVNDEDRETADLIFFPTGGGKTEAYLGLAAFTISYRRLQEPEHSGVDILMRYTLRLLTIQQFERSSSMIVALESIRRSNPRLGSNPISIGVWLGRSTTPNKKKDAVDDFRKGSKQDSGSSNPFLLSRCPSCGAQIGFAKKRGLWVGIQENKVEKSISFVCPDRECEFSTSNNPLPIFITDEEVYEKRPTYLLATVDKFARLAWVPEARAIFNIDSFGKRSGLPPALIIQDELHLISGPLGSMVGLYEPVIQELSTYKTTEGKRIRPKIVASTATTRRYKEQMHSLYGSSSVCLFPQAISRANETFFSSIEKDSAGLPKKGTLYLGVNPATFTNGQIALARVAAALSQAPSVWQGAEEKMDYYQTSMWFFNSLKDLGIALTLFNSVVRDVIQGMSLYRRLPFDKLRPLWPFKELTGRIAANEVAESLTELSRKSSQDGFIRTCLASSIMEVGVDVPRLGLLTIMFQPKSTAQYIQISGRVGRDRDEGPGLVIMLYNASRARDRSVYEKFTTYHQRLYAQVEPVSVTPFAIESMKHGLVGALLSHYRATSQISQVATAVDTDVFEKSFQVMQTRLELVANDPLKLADLKAQSNSFLKRWKNYKPTRWNYSWQKEKNNAPEDFDTALMRARRHFIADVGDQSELVPSSLRNVDGQTQLRPVANPYQEYSDE